MHHATRLEEAVRNMEPVLNTKRWNKNFRRIRMDTGVEGREIATHRACSYCSYTYFHPGVILVQQAQILGAL